MLLVATPPPPPAPLQVIDFGLSNTCDNNERLKTACGSPCYAAPEMIAGHRYVGALADIWSMGVILFALVCGYLPFEDHSTGKLYQKILNGDYQAPKFISPMVGAFFLFWAAPHYLHLAARSNLLAPGGCNGAGEGFDLQDSRDRPHQAVHHG